MRTLDQLLVKYSSVTDDVDLATRDNFLSNDVFQFDEKELQAFSQTSSKLKILCERYGLQERENEFTRLFIIGSRIKYLAENISDIWGNEEAFRYREQLYTFYNNFSVPGTKEIPLLTYQINRIGKHGAGKTNQENGHNLS